MGTSGSGPDAIGEDVREVFTQTDEPSMPLTTDEVAERVEYSKGSTKRRLEQLVEDGAVNTRQMDGAGQVWWQSDACMPSGQRPESAEFSAFVSAVKDYAIFMLDPDGSVVSWNDGAERIKGYGEDEIVGEHFSTFYTDADLDEGVPEQNLDTAAAEGRVEDEGWRVRNDGTRFWANVIITAVRNDEGDLQGFTKVTRDMTERREYEQRLRQERDLIEQIFETTPIGIGVLDSERQFIRANPQMLDRYGIDESALSEYGLTSIDVYDGDGSPMDEWPVTRVFETGDPVFDFQCQVDPPRGDRRWLSINAAPLEDDAADTDRVVAAVEDITEQKEHERQLRRERDQTEQLLRTAPIAIAVQNAAGETILANHRAQESLGLSEREILDEPEDADEWTLYDADENQLSPDETPPARVLATGEPVLDEELIIEPPSGERMQFHINATPVFDSDEAIERVITAGEDITELKKREEQLERRKTELETELSEILARISDAFYALDDEWRFTHLNDQAAEIFQRSRDELLDHELWEMFPEASDVYRDHFETAMETQEPVTFEVSVDEIETWLEFNVYPSETGLSIYFRDVTERKERERTLAKYETIVETVNDGIYVKGDDGRFTMVNEAYADLTGYGREELLGESASLVVEDATIEQAAETMIDADASSPTMEAMIETADGDVVPTEGTFATIETSTGEYEQVGVVRDVSERKEYERKIEESERRYRTLVENFPDGIVALFDSDLRYAAAGGELLGQLGVQQEEAIGETIYERYPDDLVETVEPRFQAALNGDATSFEVEYYGRHFRAQTLPIKTTGEDRMGMLVVQDITERKEYESRLEESNERLEQFAYAASHDLQEPLRMVSSYLQLIDQRYGETLDEDGKEFLEFAVDGADRMREMIDGLLEYSRIETRGDPLEPTDLDSVLSDVRDDLQLQIEESDAVITVDSVPTVAGDSNQLRQVFQNLLDNAIEYSGDEPPRIHVGAERNGNEWVLSVRDEGVGIDAADTDRIFRVFQRLHNQNEHAGTGIGLALCRRIVERHGGDIWVESEPGEGATFSFTLPTVGDGEA